MAPSVTFFIKKGCTFEVLADAGILVRDAERALLAEFDNLGNLRRFPSIAWENVWEIKASYAIGTKEGLDYALYEVQAGGSLLKLVVADQNPLVLRIATALEHGHAEGLTQIRRLVSSVGAASRLAEPAVAAKIKSLGALKTVFLNDLIETAGFEQNLGKLTPEMVEAWGELSNIALRKNVGWLVQIINWRKIAPINDVGIKFRKTAQYVECKNVGFWSIQGVQLSLP